MRGKILFLGLICLFATVGLVCRFASSQVTQPAAPSRAQQLFQHAKPHLEQVLGARLSVTPEFRTVDFKEMVRLPGWEVKAFISWRFPALEPQVRDRAYQLTHHVDCLATPARYIDGTKIILVNPDQLAKIAAWDKSLKGAQSDAFLELALVHEAARLVLEKKHDLLHRRYDPGCLEEYQIGQALREGRAQWITRQVAKRLGSEETFDLLARRWQHVPDFAPDAKQKSIYQSVFQQKYWAYVQGLRFWDHLEQSGLRNAEKVVFARPPRQKAWIENPQVYLQNGLSGGPDLKTVFNHIQERLSPRGFRRRQQPWTRDMLKQVATILQVSKDRIKTIGQWQDGRTLIWTPPKQPGKYIALTVVKFPAGNAARSYFGFAVDMQRKRDELSANSPYIPLRTVDSRYTSLKLANVEETVRNDKTVQMGSKGPTIPVTVILCRTPTHVFQFQWQGIAADAAWAERVVAAVMQAARGN